MKPNTSNLGRHEATKGVESFAAAVGISANMVVVTKDGKLRIKDQDELMVESGLKALEGIRRIVKERSR